MVASSTIERAYLPRIADQLLDELIEQVPAVQLLGPRAAGKTTTAIRRAATVVRLDRPREATAFEADPDAALYGLAEPVLLDEWQAVPEVLAAVKRAVDQDPRPGRFLITGSVRARLQAPTWAGTGRVVNVAMAPLTQREVVGRAALSPFLSRILDGSIHDVVASDRPDLRGYVELAVRGGFPDAVRMASPSLRTRWMRSYLDELVSRDAQLVDSGRDPDRLGRYLGAIAGNSAGVVDDKRLYDAAGIARETAIAYDQLLRNLFVVDAVPAWSSNRLQRLVSRPKRYLVDPGLVAAQLRVDEAGVMRDGDLLGRLIDTFVAAQLRPEVALTEPGADLYHLRDTGGRHEIDLLADMGARGIVAMEVKATAAPTRAMAKHLRWLKDQMGDRFLAGVLFHTGPSVIDLEDRILAVPIASLWS